MESQKCKNKRRGSCNIVIEGKSYIFENPKIKFIISINLSCHSKNVVDIIECNKCKEVHIRSTILNYQKIENPMYRNINSNAAIVRSKQCLSIKPTTTHYFK